MAGPIHATMTVRPKQNPKKHVGRIRWIHQVAGYGRRWRIIQDAPRIHQVTGYELQRRIIQDAPQKAVPRPPRHTGLQSHRQ